VQVAQSYLENVHVDVLAHAKPLLEQVNDEVATDPTETAVEEVQVLLNKAAIV
jgi:hypothetical protein